MPTNSFAQQSREEIIKSILNNSKSKAAWTFSKQKRFAEPKSQSQNISISNNTIFVKNHGYKFGKSNRKVFTECTDSPFPWKYNPQTPNTKQFPSFGQGRDKCKYSTYINFEQMTVPGPGNYDVKETQISHKFTMRPKTGHERTYFVENKQASQVPGPGQYIEEGSSLMNKSVTSKFRSSSLGSSTIMSKTKRFSTEGERKCLLSTSLYDTGKRSWSRGYTMGTQKRHSFIDSARKVEQPGPGNYKLPTEFGHYKATRS